MGETCETCGESECWALADWSMGGAPGEYEEAMAKHYRLGYERSQAALAAARLALTDRRRSDIAVLRSFGYIDAADNLQFLADQEALAAPAAGEPDPTCPDGFAELPK